MSQNQQHTSTSEDIAKSTEDPDSIKVKPDFGFDIKRPRFPNFLLLYHKFFLKFKF